MSKVKSSLSINPFPGIRSFEIDDHNLFFGREQQINRIIPVLTDKHFVALIGHSGCGKSSLTKAGVIPSIQKNQKLSDKEWAITVFKPGDKPLESFKDEYINSYNILHEEPIEQEKMQEIFKNSSNPVEDAFQKLGTGAWLIVIDQFEEIFRYERDNSHKMSKAQEFVDVFLNFINSKINIPVYVIITMRSDYIDHCTELEGLIEAINEGSFFIPRMRKSDLRDAIVKPIKECGGEISEDMVGRLSHELENKPEQLLVMQHALMRAWDYWIKNRGKGEPLDVEHYEAVGTISKALSIHAEEIYNELTPKEQFITEKLFKALTDTSTNPKGTRRPTSFGELLKLTGTDETTLIKIIDKFREPGCSFLMPRYYVQVTQNTIIDISSESIMRIWSRLKLWVEEERLSARLYLRLTRSAELYQQGKVGLLKDPELEIAVDWKEKNKPNSYWADRYDPSFERAMEFLEYSKKQSDIEKLQKEQKQKKELTRTRRIAVILSVASVIAVLFLIIALNLSFQARESEKLALEKEDLARYEREMAEKQRREAIAQKRIAEQQQEIAEQQKLITEEQRQYAIEQSSIARSNAKKAKISEASALASEAVAKQKEKEAKQAEKKAKEKETEAIVSKELAEKSEKKAKRLRLLAIARSMAIQAQRLATTDRELASLLAVQAYKFNMQNNGNPNDPDIFKALSNVSDDKTVFRGHNGNVREISIPGKGEKIFSVGDDGKALAWNLQNPGTKPIALIIGKLEKPGLRCVDAWSNKLVAGTNEGNIMLWGDAGKNTKPTIFVAHNGIINSIKFITGKLIVSAGSDGFIKVWDVTKTSEPEVSKKMDKEITDIALNGDKTMFAYADISGKVFVYKISNLKLNPNTLSTGYPIHAIALNSDGSKIATGHDNGSIRIWILDNKNLDPIEFSDHKSAITALAFNFNDQLLASSSYDNTIRVWDPIKEKQNPIIISGHDSWVMDIEFIPQTNILASCGNDKTIMMSPLNTNALAADICNQIKRNISKTEWEAYVGKDIEYQNTCAGNENN